MKSNYIEVHYDFAVDSPELLAALPTHLPYWAVQAGVVLRVGPLSDSRVHFVSIDRVHVHVALATADDVPVLVVSENAG